MKNPHLPSHETSGAVAATFLYLRLSSVSRPHGDLCIGPSRSNLASLYHRSREDEPHHLQCSSGIVHSMTPIALNPQEPFLRVCPWYDRAARLDRAVPPVL